MIVAIACAFLAVWLSFPSRTPADRLAALRPAIPLDRLATSPDGLATSPDGPAASLGGRPHPSAADWFPRHAVAARRRPGRRAIMSGCGVAVITMLLVGGVAGVMAGPVVGALATVLVHKQAADQSRGDRERITADLPFAMDLMVACLQAGQPVSAATEIAATAVGGPLGQRLAWVSGQLRLGADPEPAWMALAREPSMGPLARAMSRAAQSGAPIADVLTRLADDARQASRTASLAAARRVGVQAVAPLGLCFLPAFVLLGVIPVVAGLAAGVLIP
ncbi:type II secretion system F family protein [Nonomuraea sp. NPDC059194]|uniref:type II secretion system F family protein n=1 Tax=Nonomuraea sp. NPDC059194 TaxID=3346764 RepID=UPI0036AF383E